ncbi:hypothetical protein K493DRAFT_343886 [Basidiobolus meristosporus CBS 931.73]|uniref:C2 domain-containing protein n=1 Tax=Basidiobolus meristosporus CBS 931.73 TaxID=1314790 RepID=A0A1Y1ZBS9_9FUNG|nr:hypothetical protein K493DRAFT_343886 [Basidiobolus meristosporus CBS 931.73]|eukprot:ORY07710.1 hypothetical protein K493DRAFT_343886 [Basidiobolus meristosporus CBS 931.73]
MSIQVTVVEGRNLKNNDLLDKIDPIFKLYTGHGITSKEKTSAKKNDPNPVINESFNLKFDSSHNELHIELLDREMAGLDTDKVGSTIVTLGDLAARGTADGWYTLQNKSGKSVGEVHLVINFQ